MENLALGQAAGYVVACFNAATTRRPWRTHEGCPTTAHARGFNAATTRRPWRTAACPMAPTVAARLQCGHDPKAVENAHRRVPTTSASPASMRPRPEGRGERRDRGASLRHRHGELQCGHDPKAVENSGDDAGQAHGAASFNAATTRRPWRTAWCQCRSAQVVALQCGHDPKAVENGAADAARNASTWLQCGHDPKAVENDISLRRELPARGASMRPRPEGRGEPRWFPRGR